MNHNRGKTIAKDLWSADKSPKLIPRTRIRAYIYDCVYFDKCITNLRKTNINQVMNHFNLNQKQRTIIKNMISVILNRDNDNLPPILHENENYTDEMKNVRYQLKAIMVWFGLV